MINPHIEAMRIVELMEDLLDEKGIEIPCDDETEERERHFGENDAKIYGTEYGKLCDLVEDHLIEMLEKLNEEEKMETKTKEVYYDEYCKTCKHQDKEEHEDPCNECLAQGWNFDSHKPIRYEEA